MFRRKEFWYHSFYAILERPLGIYLSPKRLSKQIMKGVLIIAITSWVFRFSVYLGI
eukprot:UN05033